MPMRWPEFRPLALALVLLAATPGARGFVVDASLGSSNFQAVFDAAVGERIVAVSSAVACDVTFDVAANTVSGRCEVPLTSVTVDNEPTKTAHFREWATQKSSEPGTCRFEAVFDAVKLDAAPAAAKPASFTAAIPFKLCGRARDDGRPETVEGTVLVVPPSATDAADSRTTWRVRARIAGFDRERYGIGPQFTQGWFARVQSLAPVVAPKGEVTLSLFAVERKSR